MAGIPLVKDAVGRAKRQIDGASYVYAPIKIDDLPRLLQPKVAEQTKAIHFLYGVARSLFADEIELSTRDLEPDQYDNLINKVFQLSSISSSALVDTLIENYIALGRLVKEGRSGDRGALLASINAAESRIFPPPLTIAAGHTPPPARPPAPGDVAGGASGGGGPGGAVSPLAGPGPAVNPLASPRVASAAGSGVAPPGYTGLAAARGAGGPGALPPAPSPVVGPAGGGDPSAGSAAALHAARARSAMGSGAGVLGSLASKNRPNYISAQRFNELVLETFSNPTKYKQKGSFFDNGGIWDVYPWAIGLVRADSRSKPGDEISIKKLARGVEYFIDALIKEKGSSGLNPADRKRMDPRLVMYYLLFDSSSALGIDERAQLISDLESVGQYTWLGRIPFTGSANDFASGIRQLFFPVDRQQWFIQAVKRAVVWQTDLDGSFAIRSPFPGASGTAAIAPGATTASFAVGPVLAGFDENKLKKFIEGLKTSFLTFDSVTVIKEGNNLIATFAMRDGTPAGKFTLDRTTDSANPRIVVDYQESTALKAAIAATAQERTHWAHPDSSKRVAGKAFKVAQLTELNSVDQLKAIIRACKELDICLETSGISTDPASITSAVNELKQHLTATEQDDLGRIWVNNPAVVLAMASSATAGAGAGIGGGGGSAAASALTASGGGGAGGGSAAKHVVAAPAPAVSPPAAAVSGRSPGGGSAAKHAAPPGGGSGGGGGHGAATPPAGGRGSGGASAGGSAAKPVAAPAPAPAAPPPAAAASGRGSGGGSGGGASPLPAPVSPALQPRGASDGPGARPRGITVHPAGGKMPDAAVAPAGGAGAGGGSGSGSSAASDDDGTPRPR